MDVLVIGSGATEREALPWLLSESISRTGRGLLVRHPPSPQRLTPSTAAQLIIAHYWASYPRPEKAVVLVDADSAEPDQVIAQMETALMPRIVNVTERGLTVLITAAKWHLEAWFFADAQGLREYLGRDLGSVDISDPESMCRPKHHLQRLLNRPYTSSVAREIARSLKAAMIRGKSGTFRLFELAFENGG